MRGHRTISIGRTIGLAATLLLLGGRLPAQVPSKIPSDPEAQIFDLIKRVTALEEKLAALTNGSAVLKVRAPFVVTDAAGEPVLQVTNGPTPLGKEGVIIARDHGSDIGAVALYSSAGQDLVKLLQGPGKPGGIVLGDTKGVDRAEFTGDGRLAVSDESGEDYLVIAENVSKEDAGIRIGGVTGGYAVEVGAPNSKGAAVLGTDDGVGMLALSDEQERQRAVMDGSGRLEVSDDAGRDILAVSEEVTEKNAGVAISLTDGAGQVRVTDVSGKPAAGIMGDTRSIATVGSSGKVTAEMLTSEAGGGLFQAWGAGGARLAVLGQGTGKGGVVQISNGQVTVSTLMASDGGAGRLQLTDAGGTPVVEAGVLGSGRGIVRVGPRYRCGEGSNAGIPAAGLGMAVKALMPDCILGLP